MKTILTLTITAFASFLLTACGGGSETDHGLINQPPVASSESLSAAANGSLAITLRATDPNSDRLSFTITTPPSHGTLTGTPPHITYTPKADYTGEDRIGFTASDGKEKSDEAFVHITVKAGIPAIRSLSLTLDRTALSKDANTNARVTATYADGKSADVTDQVEWVMDTPDALAIQNHTLTALKDINVTLRAKLNGTLSNPVALSIYWEVNGHRLPPEPDPAVNNATLLGVDVNHNGVRDDVERWIYKEYKDKHPIHIDIAMQAARGYRLVLEKQPKTKDEAMKIMNKVDSSAYCELYYRFNAKYFNEPILIHDDIVGGYLREKTYLNTKERHDIYMRYDALFSGDSYTLIPFKDRKAACDFNASKYNEE
jgi:hypothetical protein